MEVNKARNKVHRSAGLLTQLRWINKTLKGLKCCYGLVIILKKYVVGSWTSHPELKIEIAE